MYKIDKVKNRIDADHGFQNDRGDPSKKSFTNVKVTLIFFQSMFCLTNVCEQKNLTQNYSKLLFFNIMNILLKIKKVPKASLSLEILYENFSLF